MPKAVSPPPQQKRAQADELLIAIDAEECRRSLKQFMVSVWPIIEPAPFVDGWVIDCVCEHLEAVARGDIRKILITIPPRHTKSLLVVIWRAWLWARDPSEQILGASYSYSLSMRDNLRVRRIIEDPWYQARYGHEFQLASDQNVKGYFESTRQGTQMAMSVDGGTTGHGGSLLVLDDAHHANEAHSDAERESAVIWFREVWTNRLNDQNTGRMATIGQRIGVMDVPGYILRERPDWVHVNLPAEFEPSRRCVTPIWQDPRTTEGELLWPARFSKAALDGLKRDLGPLGYAAQYQQSPVPPGGYIFNKANERLFTIDEAAGLYLLHTPEGLRAVPIAECALHITSDVAAKAKEQSDFTVFSVWAITPRKELLLLYVLRAHLLIPRQVEKGYEVYQAYVNGRFHALWFEDVAYQSALGQFLIEKGVPCLPFYPKVDKVLRAGGASVWMQAGNVYFLAGASWLEDWRAEIYQFPKGEHDDQVDTLSAMVIIVKGQPIPLQGDEVPEPQPEPSLIAVIAENQQNPFDYADRLGIWGND